MRWIRGPSGIFLTLMAIVALMFCASSAGADKSVDINNTQAIVAVLENGHIEVFAQFHATLLDGLAVHTELVVDYRGENMANASDSVGISGEPTSFYDADSHFFGAQATHAIFEYYTPVTTRGSDVPGIVLMTPVVYSNQTTWAILDNADVVLMFNLNSFTMITAVQGALLPGSTLVVQQFANTTNVKVYGDGAGVIRGGCYAA